MRRFLTEQEKITLLKDFEEVLNGEVGDKIVFSKPVEKKKTKIFYTPEAYEKSVRLVMSHTTEIAWHNLVRRVEDGFEVYDVLSYPQTVGPAHVNVKMGRTFGDGQKPDPKKFYNDWYIDLLTTMSEGQENDLCGQCHSHVNMGTSPSSVDRKQQEEELQTKNSGFYLFQIWNKKLDINTFLYDIDNGILYEKEDVELIVEDDEFTKLSHEMLTEPEPVEKREKGMKKKEKPLPFDFTADLRDWQKKYLNNYIPDPTIPNGLGEPDEDDLYGDEFEDEEEYDLRYGQDLDSDYRVGYSSPYRYPYEW